MLVITLTGHGFVSPGKRNLPTAFLFESDDQIPQEPLIPCPSPFVSIIQLAKTEE